ARIHFWHVLGWDAGDRRIASFLHFPRYERGVSLIGNAIRPALAPVRPGGATPGRPLSCRAQRPTGRVRRDMGEPLVAWIATDRCGRTCQLYTVFTYRPSSAIASERRPLLRTVDFRLAPQPRLREAFLPRRFQLAPAPRRLAVRGHPRPNTQPK